MGSRRPGGRRALGGPPPACLLLLAVMAGASERLAGRPCGPARCRLPTQGNPSHASLPLLQAGQSRPPARRRCSCSLCRRRHGSRRRRAPRRHQRRQRGQPARAPTNWHRATPAAKRWCVPLKLNVAWKAGWCQSPWPAHMLPSCPFPHPPSSAARRRQLLRCLGAGGVALPDHLRPLRLSGSVLLHRHSALPRLQLLAAGGVGQGARGRVGREVPCEKGRYPLRAPRAMPCHEAS